MTQPDRCLMDKSTKPAVETQPRKYYFMGQDEMRYCCWSVRALSPGEHPELAPQLSNVISFWWVLRSDLFFVPSFPTLWLAVLCGIFMDKGHSSLQPENDVIPAGNCLVSANALSQGNTSHCAYVMLKLERRRNRWAINEQRWTICRIPLVLSSIAWQFFSIYDKTYQFYPLNRQARLKSFLIHAFY